MPAFSTQPVAVLNSTSPMRKNHYPYSEASMGSKNIGGRQGATSNRNSSTSVYSQFREVWAEKAAEWTGEQNILETTTPKSKKTPQRPSTPHNNRNNNIEKTRKSVQTPVPKSTSVKKSSQQTSPSLKQKPVQVRPVTPSTRPQLKLKKNDGVSSTTKVTRSVTPSSPKSNSAHSLSHVRSKSPEKKSAHSRSHAHVHEVRVNSPTNTTRPRARAASPENSTRPQQVRSVSPEVAALREELKKYKMFVRERDEWLRNKSDELSEAEDLLTSFQERVREVEARNRELQAENELMRNHIEEENKKKQSNSNGQLIKDLSGNINRVRGGSAAPSSPSSPSLSSPKVVSPPSSPTTTKYQELLKANNLVKNEPPMVPRIVQARGNLMVNKVAKNPQNDLHVQKPTAPTPVVVNLRHEPYQSASDRKTAAALNVVMEDSEDSDEFTFDNDDNSSDDQDSESEASTDDDDDDNASSGKPSNNSPDTENDDGYNQSGEEDDDNDEFDKWSTHASSKLNVVEEEDEEEEVQGEEEETQQSTQNNSSSNPIESVVSITQVASDDIHNRDSISSDSGFEESLPSDKSVSPQQIEDGDQPGDCYPNRNSISNSSDDSVISISSQNDPYHSPVTSPSSTDSDSDSSSTKSIKSINTSKSNNLDVNTTSVSESPSNDSVTSPKLSGLENSKRSSNNGSKSNSRSTSPITTRPISPTTSSRPSTPISNVSTARAKSPISPPSPMSSRASTPASEISRNSYGQTPQSDNSTCQTSSPDDKCSTVTPDTETTETTETAIPPPPPPPASKDPFAVLQHYLKLISENSSMENPLKTYDINKVIDEGSSAKVYTAHPLSNPSEECAIKVVPLSYSLEFIFNEIYVLKNLKHKNVVDFKESFLRWDGKTREVWIAMEKCARGDVTSRAGKVSQREVGRIAGDLLNALKHLHSKGIIHRDIKLSNILATANNEIKLADFGIASLTPTSTTSMVGTIPYMAPDVVLVGPERPYDTKVDIWSVGVCILELLTGKAAWGRSRDDEIMDKLRRGEVPYGFQRLRKKADIGWEAVDFLEQCFVRTPDNRWSAEKLLEHPFITSNRN